MAEKTLRCAVYTRKSTEDGLDQEFNSLDAQYEACAAYAASQRHEGWVLSEERYDDGGYSGGNMERPGLKRLLSDVEAGLVDIILLYKIDRLTRSLSDFARIVEVLDRKEASFVSITQSFNTTTSMGRLTLNMLLSFAQFEREVTGERIRDKIAASKRKGMWMGGPVPLGYRVEDRRLVIVEEEAEKVRHIMERYLALGSVPALVDELDHEGFRTKVQKKVSGPHRGGCRYRRGTLYHLLSNRIYRGQMVHKGEAFEGEHEAIVDEDLFAKVQRKLAANAGGSSRRKKVTSPSLLIGLLEDGEGRAMTPSHSGKSGKTKRYRYYVTRADQVDGNPAWRVPAADLERIVCEALSEQMTDQRFLVDLAGGDCKAEELQRILSVGKNSAEILAGSAVAEKADLLKNILRGVTVGETQVTVRIDLQSVARLLGVSNPVHAAQNFEDITVPTTRVRKGHQLRLVIPPRECEAQEPPKHDPKLLTLLVDAFQARDLVFGSPELSLAAIAAREGRCRTHLGRLAAISCLAPDIIESVVEGRHSPLLTAKNLMAAPLPLDWEDQRALFAR